MKKAILVIFCYAMIVTIASCNNSSDIDSVNTQHMQNFEEIINNENCNDFSSNELDSFDLSNDTSALDHSDEKETREESPIADFEFEFSPNFDAVYITKYVGDSDHVVIPAKINGIAVTALKGQYMESSISSGVFEDSTIKAVVIPNSVTSIGFRAFKNCKELADVYMSSQCNMILDSAFQNCKNLKSIDLSNSKISSIGISAFEKCVSLSEVKFSDSLLKIDRRAFYDCSQLLEIHFPPNLVSIEEEAFFNCISLKTVVVSAKLNLMSFDAVRFYNMPSLETIAFEEGRETIEGYAFFDITTNVNIIIPKSVKKFTSYPFFCHGSVKFIFLGDCPEIFEKIDFYGEPTIYYDPNTRGWDDCLWKNQYPLVSIQ